MRRQTVVQKKWILTNPIEEYIIREVEELNIRRAARLAELFQMGCETAYIARYREDVHGGMRPERIRKAKDAYLDAVALNAKVTTAINTITAKVPGINDKRAITERLQRCEDFEELADISKEYATGSRKTKANVARELGLETPAKSILEGNYVNFANFVSKDLKTVKEVEEHTKALLADLINKDVEVRKVALKIIKQETKCQFLLTSQITNDARNQPRHNRILDKYSDYIGMSTTAEAIKDHTISALNRGVDEGILNWRVEFEEEDAKRLHPFSQRNVFWEMRTFFKNAVNYSIRTLFIPMIERGVKRFLSKKSEERGIFVFGRNVEQLFCHQGVHSKYVIALDPGYLVKAAFLEPSGKVLSMDEFIIRDSTFENRGIALLREWSSQTMGKDIVIAIGNGSKTYNTQKAVSKMIENNEFQEGIDVCFCIVPEHGASKYSCTDAAREEFGEDAEIKQISAVSIGRRLIDPMSEYVKIEPQHLGKGQYQQSINCKLLKQKLDDVVRDRVSLNGVDVNTASEELLKNICGLSQKTAAEIVKYREQNGRIRSREELKRVRGIEGITFQQCSGFLTVSRPDDFDNYSPVKRLKELSASFSSTWSPLDETVVHPDDYDAAMRLLKKLHLTVDQIKSGVDIQFANKTPEEDRILKLLTNKPELKPPPTMMKMARNLKDLRNGQQFSGTVSNQTDFGVFVDIGVERDGLVRISQYIKKISLSKNPKQDVAEIVPSVGDQIEVIIKEVWKDGRISLTLA